jgi:HupE / UreJ protein
MTLILGFGGQALAHTKSQSSSRWEVAGTDVRMVFQVNSYRATLLAAYGWDQLSPPEMLARHLPDQITVTQGTIPCLVNSRGLIKSSSSVVKYETLFTCPNPIATTTTEVSVTAFFGVSASHQHILSAGFETGESIERILSEGRSVVLLTPQTGSQSFWEMASLGTSHALSGVDHVLFILALVLLGRGLRSTLLLVTCFTIGHMVSLYFAVYGVITPNASLLEALIGLSISIVALNVLHQVFPLKLIYAMWGAAVFFGAGVVAQISGFLPVSEAAFVAIGLFVFLDMIRLTRGGQTNWLELGVITFLFSLAHGAGFAGGMQDLISDRSVLFYQVLSFNVGVEIAQIILVATFVILLWIAGKTISDKYYLNGRAGIAVGLVWAGSYYFFKGLLL